MSEGEAPAIETSGLTRRFGKVTAVTGLHLCVQRLEVFGLAGPDGSGKTTTLRMLAGLVRPSAGWARVAGFDVGREHGKALSRIGHMAQRFNLFGDLTVTENLRFHGDLFQVPQKIRREREAKLLEFARLTEFRDRRGAKLSGGMQKKLALACSLIHQPEIVFLDEPTTGVDPVSRREFWDILGDLHELGTTVIVSTPYMDKAERCSRVGLLHQGRLVTCDTPEAIRAMPTGELLEVRATPLRQAQAVLDGLEGVIEVQSYGDLLHIFVDDSGAREGALSGALSAHGVTVHQIRRIRPRMEEAFVSLIRRQMSAEPVETKPR